MLSTTSVGPRTKRNRVRHACYQTRNNRDRGQKNTTGRSQLSRGWGCRPPPAAARQQQQLQEDLPAPTERHQILTKVKPVAALLKPFFLAELLIRCECRLDQPHATHGSKQKHQKTLHYQVPGTRYPHAVEKGERKITSVYSRRP